MDDLQQDQRDDGLELLEDDGFGTKLGAIVQNSPLLVFGALSALSLLLIVGVVAVISGGEPSGSAPPAAPVDVRTAQGMVRVSAELTGALAEEDRFLREVHPLLSIDEIRQTALPTGFLGEDLGRLHRMRLALQVDLRETLRRADHPAYAFDASVAGLRAVEDEGVTSYLRLQDLSSLLRQRLAQVRADERAATRAFEISTNTSGALDAAALQEMARLREEEATLRARLQLVEDTRAAYPSTLLAVRARIAGALANRELLIRDLETIDIDGAGLVLARRGLAEHYYHSDRLPSSALRPSGGGFGAFPDASIGSFGFGASTGGFDTSPTEDLPGLRIVDPGPGGVPYIRMPFLQS